MAEPLHLLRYFPPITDSQWQNLIKKDYSWEPLEGIKLQPYYRRAKFNDQHLFHHRDWLICAETQLSQAVSAQRAGAESLSFLIDKPEPLPETVPVGELPLFFRGNSVNYDFFLSLCELAKSKGYEPSQLQGAVVFAQPIERDLVINAAKHTQLWTQEIDLCKWHDQGASLVQEIACAFADLSDVLDSLTSDISPAHLYVRVPVGERMILEIARLRALRIGISQILRAYNTPLKSLPIQGVPSLRYKSVLDPKTHLIRQTLQCIAAIIGGCNAIVSSTLGDELMIQHILRQEGKFGEVADATAGAWMIEHVTNCFAQAGWALFQKIESKGGLQKARSWIESEIQHTQDQRCEAVLSGEDIVIGGNTYLSEQFEDAIPEQKSLIAPLESIRIKANSIKPRATLRVLGSFSPWLKCLIELCAFQIDEHDAMITVTETADGFVAQNAHNQQISFDHGGPLDVTADRLLKLAQPHAP